MSVISKRICNLREMPNDAMIKVLQWFSYSSVAKKSSMVDKLILWDTFQELLLNHDFDIERFKSFLLICSKNVNY